MTIFDWIKEILINKSDWNSFSELDKKEFNVYMINRILSMDINFIELVNDLQTISYYLDKEILYKLYCGIFFRNNAFIKYVKSNDDKDNKYKKEDIDQLSRLFKLGSKDVRDYLDILYSKKKEYKEYIDRIIHHEKIIKKSRK